MAQFNGIAIGIASSGRKTDLRWSLSLPSLVAPVGMSVAWLVKTSDDRAANRQTIAEAAVKGGASYLFFLDDDTVCPNFTLLKLHSEIEKDPTIMVCGGIYCTKQEIPAPIVFKKLGGGPFYNWKTGDVFECAGLGAGCMLIKTEVFQHLEKPWFFEPHSAPEDRVSDINGEDVPLAHEGGTDDLYFCDKVSKAGFKIMAHGGVLPIHLDQEGNTYSLPIDSYPCKGAGLKPWPKSEGVNTQIPGWMSEEELKWLYNKASKFQSIVEIGSWAGRSTYSLLSGCPGTVTAIDHFLGTPSELETTHAEAKISDVYDAFMSNVGHFSNLEVLKMDSTSASEQFVDKSVEMIFIDGDHTYDAVLADLKVWVPKCSRFLCGHDRDFTAVEQALKDFGIVYKEGPGSIWYIEV